MEKNKIEAMVNINDIRTFDELRKKSKYFIKGVQDLKEIKINEKKAILRIIYNGYTTLPDSYHKAFLDPLLNLIQSQNYSELKKFNIGYGTPIYDWISCIYQRYKRPLTLATRAFEEFTEDIFSAFRSNAIRNEAILPERQELSPLVKWGGDGAYTWPVHIGSRFGMKISVVNLPKSYSENIALWPLCVHECYHDVVHSYENLLNELEDKIEEEFLKRKDEEFFKDPITWNGKESSSLGEFASKYWRFTMDETSADVLGLLNAGPATGISLAILAMAERNDRLVSDSYIGDPHPNDTLRIALVSEVIRNFEQLDIGVRNSYIEFFDTLIKEYKDKKNNFVLYSILLDNETKNNDVIVCFKGMLKTVEIVAKTIGFTKLNSLGNHSLSELNTWKNRDQILVQRIASDFIENKLPYLEKGPDKQSVYATHIVSAATVALVKNPTAISNITTLAIQSLNELYKNNPVWNGFPVLSRSDFSKHYAMLYLNKNTEVSKM